MRSLGACRAATIVMLTFGVSTSALAQGSTAAPAPPHPRRAHSKRGLNN